MSHLTPPNITAQHNTAENRTAEQSGRTDLSASWHLHSPPVVLYVGSGKGPLNGAVAFGALHTTTITLHHITQKM